jgi:hypothetical protein
VFRELASGAKSDRLTASAWSRSKGSQYRVKGGAAGTNNGDLLMTLAAITAQQTLIATRGLDIDERLAQSIE